MVLLIVSSRTKSLSDVSVGCVERSNDDKVETIERDGSTIINDVGIQRSGSTIKIGMLRRCVCICIIRNVGSGF